jgi:hypothetical protein
LHVVCESMTTKIGQLHNNCSMYIIGVMYSFNERMYAGTGFIGLLRSYKSVQTAHGLLLKEVVRCVRMAEESSLKWTVCLQLKLYVGKLDNYASYEKQK